MKKKSLLIISLLLYPMTVFASDGSVSEIIEAIMMEAFVTIHMSIFVFIPLSKLYGGDDSKKLFWKMFITRVVILLFCDIFISPNISAIDFFCVFLGAFVVVPISGFMKRDVLKEKLGLPVSNLSSVVSNTSMTPLKCSKCNNILKPTDKFCIKCGTAVSVPIVNNNKKNSPVAQISDYDTIYKLNEDKMLTEFVTRELKKCKVDVNSKLIPSDELKRKKILMLIFSGLLFVFISLIFFHFPIYTYIIGFIILFILFKKTIKYDLISYLKKQIKARPSEKVSNIIMGINSTFVPDDSKVLSIIGVFVAVVVPLIIFYNPRVLYEADGNGYGVRFYTFGVTNYKSVSIPEKYKGKDVVSLRGNAFSNMVLLTKVDLPDTITSIRGQAFKNDKSLKNIRLPKNLEYLGGGSFYNCSSLTSISLPDSLTYMGGETFYGATSLKTVKLSNNLEEIRGDSFENCESLLSITIPDKVKRIGGHAFYGDSSLKEVLITENSQLTEIGSSAFRLCSSLNEITLPVNTSVNERSFKESPTNVKRFGDVDFDSLINKDDYKYSSYMFIREEESSVINKYYSDTIISNNESVTLLSIDTINDSSVFNMKYTGNDGELLFSLSSDEPYKVLNDNVVIRVDNMRQFNNDSYGTFYVYYN